MLNHLQYDVARVGLETAALVEQRHDGADKQRDLLPHGSAEQEQTQGVELLSHEGKLLIVRLYFHLQCSSRLSHSVCLARALQSRVP